MNKQGHTQSLVPAHPGNRNALKSGFYSADVVGSRIEAAEQWIASTDIDDLRVEFFRSEVARLTVLRDAADEALSTGIVGRGGKPRALLDQRLRISTKLQRAEEGYLGAMAEREVRTPGAVSAHHEPVGPVDLVSVIAQHHSVSQISEITPENFSPNEYLLAVMETEDPAVTIAARRRAQRNLTRREGPSPTTCLCYPEGPPLAEAAFSAAVELGGTPTTVDRDQELANAIECFVTGRNLENQIWFRQAHQALDEIIEATKNPEATPRAIRGRLQPPPAQDTEHRAYWRTLLSSDPSLGALTRLSAFEGLDEAGALHRCSCPSHPLGHLAEGRYDAVSVWVLHVLMQKDQAGAQMRGMMPKTYRALTSAIEAGISSDARTSDDT